MADFRELVHGDDDAIANWCAVEADSYFVAVVTDYDEGLAHMHVSVARALIPALYRAIAHVEAQQALAELEGRADG